MKIEITNAKEKNGEYATIKVSEEEIVQLHNGCVAGSWHFQKMADKLKQFLPQKKKE